MCSHFATMKAVKVNGNTFFIAKTYIPAMCANLRTARLKRTLNSACLFCAGY